MGLWKKAKKAAKKVTKQATGLVKNVVNSPVNAVSSLVKGDIVGAVTNVANVASMGTIDTTGKQQGIVNVNAPKVIAGVMGVKASTSSAETPLSESSLVDNTKKKKGLLSQLRQGRGAVGGGSYTTTVKNPLGGSSGKTGK